MAHIAIPTVASFLILNLFLTGTAFLMGIGISFVVFVILALTKLEGIQIYSWLRAMGAYLLKPKRFTSRPEGKGHPSRDIVPLLGIDNGIMISKRNRASATYAIAVRLKPPNFTMMRRHEQDASLAAFFEVLSGIEYEAQVLAHAEPFDPTDYFRSAVGQIKQHKLSSMRKYSVEFMNYFEQFLKQGNCLQRHFYLLLSAEGPIPSENDGGDVVKQRAKVMRRLLAQARNVQHRFTAIDAKADILDNQGAIDMLRLQLNPRSHSKESSLRSALKPEPEKDPKLRIPDVEIHPTYVKLGNDYIRFLQIKEYPDYLPVAWLDDVVSMSERITLSFHYETKHPQIVLRRLKTSKASTLQAISIKQKKGTDATEELQTVQEIERQILQVSGRITQFYESTVVLGVHATTLDELENLTGEIDAKLRNLNLVVTTERWRQQQLLLTSLPLGHSHMKSFRQTMDTHCATGTYPFLTTHVHHQDGIWMGVDVKTNTPYIIDRWQFANYNRIIAGGSGSGKSFTIKMDMARTLMVRPNARLIVIDPLREFTDVTAALNGQIIFVGHPSTKINPFDLGKHQESRSQLEENPYYAKLSFLDAFFSILLPSMSPLETAFLNQRTQELYARFGITPELESHKNTPPTMEDLLEFLAHVRDNDADAQWRAVAKNLIVRLEPIVHGNMTYLNGQTNIDVSNQVVCFDLESLDETQYNLMMFVVLNYIEATILSSYEHTVLYIDEAWHLMDRPVTAKALAQLSRHTRHYNCGMDLVTQTPDSFTKDEYGNAIRANCQQALFFRSEPMAPHTIQAFNLDPSEADHITRLGEAKELGHAEAVYKMGRNKAWLALYSSDEEYNLITSDPAELLARQAPSIEEATPA